MVKLKLKVFEKKDLFTHGASIMEDPFNNQKVFVGMINHRKDGSVIELFEFTIGSDEMIYIETVKDDLIFHPNEYFTVNKF